jgi:small subunit ribosomal protein S1
VTDHRHRLEFASDGTSRPSSAQENPVGGPAADPADPVAVEAGGPGRNGEADGAEETEHVAPAASASPPEGPSEPDGAPESEHAVEPEQAAAPEDVPEPVPAPDESKSEAVGSTDEATESGSEPGPEATTASDKSEKDAGEESAEAKPAAAKPKRSRKPHVASLYRAMRSRRPVDGTVKAVIKGGYEIQLGKTRGFCPHSQIDLHRVDNPEIHVGQRYPFRVIQIRRGGDDVVVSRRAILEEQRKEEAGFVRATLVEGAVMRGHVAAIADFGVFVDLGAGVRGLVHVSELAHSRVTRVKDVVKLGDELQVKILKLDTDTGKISLSVREATRDPWADVEQRFAVGKSYPGTVKRLTQFGAFVELEPGVEALAPASELPPMDKPWQEELAVGTSRDWLVLSVQPQERRISLTVPVPGVGLESVARLDVGDKLSGRVQRLEDFGVFVWLGPGRVGLMPFALSGAPRGTDAARRFPLGSEVEVEVRDITDDGRRIRLAKQGLAPAARRPAREARPPKRDSSAERPAPAPQGGSFGTSLADKLRAALGESRNS